MFFRRSTAALAAMLLAVTVSTASAPRPESAEAAQNTDPSSGDALTLLQKRVKYVFVIYQENRSFDSYFGTFPGADGLYSQPAEQTAGFTQPIVNVDGSSGTIVPFRIGPAQFAADTDDVDHSHGRIDAKMDVDGSAARMDRFALTEEKKYSPTGNPSLLAKQFGELAMAHEDCDTVPFLAEQPHDAYVDAAVHPANERVQQEGREPTAALAIYFMHYNFCRKHQTIKTTPAIKAGLTDRLWTLPDLARLQDLMNGGLAA